MPALRFDLRMRQLVPAVATESSTEPGGSPSGSRRAFLASAAGVGVASVAGCLDRSGGGDGDGEDREYGPPGWKTYRGDRRRTGLAKPDAGPGSSLSVAWETSVFDVAESQMDGSLADAAQPDDENQFEGTAHCSDVSLTEELVLCTAYYQLPDGDAHHDWGGIVALDAETGSIEWTVGGIPPRMQAPSIVGQHAVLPVRYPVDEGQGAHLLVVDTASGSVERRAQFPWDLGSTTSTITPDAAYLSPRSDTDGTVAALNPETGAERWSVDAPFPIAEYWAFTVADDSIVYAGKLGEETRLLVALDTASGEELWRRTLQIPSLSVGRGDLLGAPTIVDGRGYVTTGERAYVGRTRWGSSLRSFDASDGSPRWQFLPDGVPVDDMPSNWHQLHNCAERSSCSLSESYAGLRGVPLVVDDRVVVPGIGLPASNAGSHDEYQHLYAVEDADGSLAWSVPGTFGSAVAAGDVLYAQKDETAVVAVSADGELLDTVETEKGPSRVPSPSVGHGRLYTQWGNGGSSSTPGRAHTVVALE